MNVQEIRDRFNRAPDWMLVEVMSRLEAIEARLAALENRKPGRPKKVKDGAK